MADLDPAMQIKVTFELHEAVALGILYTKAPSDIDLWDEGQWWGNSVDLAHLRLAEAISKATKNKEGLLWAGALRARLDQSGG